MAFAFNTFAEAPFAAQGSSSVDVIVEVTGSQSSSLIGSVTTQANAIVTPTGSELTSVINSVTVDLNTEVSVTGSQLSLDQGERAVSFTALANAQISTAQSKFGGSSLELDGTGDRIRSEDITLGTGNFTWETFARFNSLSSTQCIWDGGENVGANPNPVVYITSTNLQWSFGGGTYINQPHGMSVDTWHHIALTRNSGTLTAYIDGTSIGTASIGNINCTASNHVLGGNFAGTFTMNGYLDESRLTRNVIYTSNFTPPTSPFTPTQDDFWVLHYDGANGSTNIVNSAIDRVATVTADANVSVTGFDLSWTIGTFSVTADGNVSVIVTEHDLQTSMGDVTVPIDVDVPLTGIQATLNLGEETVDVSVEVPVTGILSNSNIGSVEVKLNTPVDVSGIQISTNIGIAAGLAWADVDPDVTNNWPDVDPDVTNTWTDVDPNVSNTFLDVDPNVSNTWTDVDPDVISNWDEVDKAA